MYWKKVIYKRCVFLSLLSIIFLLFGCGQSDNPLTLISDSDVNEEVEEMESIDTKIEDKTDTDGTNKTSEGLPESLAVLVNTQAEDVYYLCKDGIDPLRAIHRCISDGENIFLAYNEPDIFIMPIGANEHSPVNIENREGLNVCNVAIDASGRTHLLMTGQNYDEWYIWRLDENYQIDKVIDISTYCETKYIPIWFLIDKDGTYYFQWPKDRNGIIVDSEGVIKHKITPESLGLSWIYEAAVGKDGQIYLVYSKEGDKLKLGELDVETGSIKNENAMISFPDNEVFTAMSAGTDTNLLLFSPYSGVWACDNEKDVFENRMKLSDIHFGNDMEYWPLTFLPDGRILLMGRKVNADFTEDATLLMKHIPVGR